MKPTKPWCLIGILTLVLTAAGCAMSDIAFHFNGRTVEVEKLREARFPRGLEITYFDGKVMKVNGKEPISVNGKELSVSGSTVRYGDFQAQVGPNHKMVIGKTGEFTIHDQEAAADGKSGWQFWR